MKRTPRSGYLLSAFSEMLRNRAPGIGLGVLACVAMCASAAIANEPQREYELVTPGDKPQDGIPGMSIGGGIVPLGISSPSGASIGYETAGAMPGAEAAGNTNFHISERKSNGWTTHPLTPPQTTYPDTSPVPIFEAFSRDLSKVVFQTADPPLVSDAQSRIVYLYARDTADNSYQRLSAAPVDGPPPLISPNNAFAGASADFHHVVYRSGGFERHTEDSPVAQVNVYESVAGLVRLVSVLPDGTPSPGGGTPGDGAGNRSVQGAISRDGSRIFWTRIGGDQGIYMRAEGSTTVHVSASQRDVPDPNGIRPARFHAASADGSTAIISSSEELTNDANTGPSAAGRDLYRFDVGTAELTDLTVSTDPSDPNGANVLGVLGVSRDASQVYFVATGNLAEGATSGQPNLYRADEDGVKFIATLASDDHANWDRAVTQRTSRVTPSGLHLVFTSVESLTGYDNRHADTDVPMSQVFLYDATVEELVCISCNPSGVRPIGGSSILESGQRARAHQASRNISNDGRYVFFNSRDALVSDDTNAVMDVYEWHDGDVSIVSKPTSSATMSDFQDGEWGAKFVDASADGSTVFFTTAERLVSQDVDDLGDIYAARIGGGFSLDPSVECELDCQDASSPAPALTPPGTPGVEGAGNVERPSLSVPRLNTKQHRRLARGRPIAVRANVSGPGRVVVIARAKLRLGGNRVRIARARTQTQQPGTVAVRGLRLNRRAQRTLRRQGRLQLRLVVRFRGKTRAQGVRLRSRGAGNRARNRFNRARR